MKVIQIPYCFYPEAVGGTEIYVESLVKSLGDKGVDIVISPPKAKQAEIYFYNGIKVKSFAVPENLNSLLELYGRPDREEIPSFGKILDEEKPDLVHLHAFTCRISLRLVREAKKRAIPVIFTYHTPGVTCQRGTLMRWGNRSCRGGFDLTACAACVLHGLGLPKAIAAFFGAMPKGINDVLARLGLSGGIWTAMRMRGLISVRHATLRSFMNEVDRIIVLCNWTREALLENGVPQEKIVLVKHGLSDLNEDKVTELDAEEGRAETDTLEGFLSVVSIGRLSYEKGLDILIRAIRYLPEAPIRLDIYGTIQDEAGKKYLQKLKRITAKDERIVFKNAAANDYIRYIVKKYHVLAVPSQLPETGPLAVLEAFQAKVPVIGSGLGGIAELVEDGINGILVESGSVKAWALALTKCLNDKSLLKRLRSGIKKPKTMDSVAEKMKELYEEIVLPKTTGSFKC